MLISQPVLILRQWTSMLSYILQNLPLLFPKIFCISTLTWSIYVLLLEACYNQIIVNKKSPLIGCLVGLVGIIMYLLAVYSYFMTLRGGGSPSDFKELRIRDIEQLKQQSQRNQNQQDQNHKSTDQDDDIAPGNEPDEGAALIANDEPPTDYVNFHILKPGVSPFRYCEKCRAWKPDRTHHCSTCNRCILRMDHHCPWYASCIGYHNQKFFIQNLAYVSTFAGYCFLVSLSLLWKFFSDESYTDSYLSLKLVFLFIIGLAFSIAVGIFALFSMWLITKNMTTIEFQESRWIWGEKKNKFQYEFDSNGKKKDIGNIFNIGFMRNWKSVMGPNIWYWILPLSFTLFDINSNSNGINFDIDDEVYEKWCYNIRLQEQLNQQLDDYRERLHNERFS